jgi:hypothetical protein
VWNARWKASVDFRTMPRRKGEPRGESRPVTLIGSNSTAL